MSTAEIVASDDLFEIEVSDVRPALGVTRGRCAPGHRLSTRLRARRFAASLLALALLALNLAPGGQLSVLDTPLMTPESARALAQSRPGGLSGDPLMPWQRPLLMPHAVSTLPGRPRNRPS